MIRCAPLTAFVLAAAALVAWGQEETLLEARKGHTTKILTQEGYEADGRVGKSSEFQIVHYESAVGPLVGYLTPAPTGDAKRPAVIYAHGGFGGIGDWLEEKEIVTAFREAGFVVFCPSWRGENDNPGKFELFYGEVDDALAAFDYVEALPYVDPKRIYMAGHSTGGTVTLLTALAQPKLRAAFSFGGSPNIADTIQGGGYGNTPFDPEDAQEARLRSALPFAKTLQVPTIYFEGDDSSYNDAAIAMEQALSSARPRRFQAHVVEEGDHFNVIQVLGPWLVQHLEKDRGETYGFWPRVDVVRREFRRGYAKVLRDRIASDPKDAQPWLDLGVLRLNEGRWAPARDAFNRALSLRPGWDLAHFDRGLALHNLERFKEAIADYTVFVEANPEAAIGYSMRGQAYLELGQILDAEKDLAEAARLDPSDPEIQGMHQGVKVMSAGIKIFFVFCLLIGVLIVSALVWLGRRKRGRAAPPAMLFDVPEDPATS